MERLGTQEQERRQPEACGAMRRAIHDILKKRQSTQPRQFIRFPFLCQAADDCRIREVLRSPQIYALHPEPQVAAQLRVAECYGPRVSEKLFNYTSISRSLEEVPAAGSGETCPCRKAFRSGVVAENHCQDGHLCTSQLSALKWTYLQALHKKGRRFRFQAMVEEVMTEFWENLAAYVAWYERKHSTKRPLLDKWARAVWNRCLLNLKNSTRRRNPDGYGDLNKQSSEAQQD